MTSEQAAIRLKTMTAWETSPKLDQGEIDQLVVIASRADSEGRAPSDEDWEPTFDLTAAALEGWRWKLGKASGNFAFSEDGQSFHREQVVKHCETMIAEYRRKLNRSAPLGGYLARIAPADDEDLCP